ncbi:MAG: L,D-transpeptidase family protein [Sphingomonas sp.]|nr:L,D-transpeptidase family protein [Sphingomonas sp.]
MRVRALVLAGAVALVATTGTAQMQPITGGSVLAAVERLRPGQFLWAPQIAPQGPMLVVVNIATQRLVAYRNGVPIAVSTVSTGKPGHATPLGVFTVLQKAETHFSSKYNRAPMPFMQKLTWNGIALHAGNLPGYPASHGCIRLPNDFAKLLFGETALGMTVVVVNQAPQLRLGPSAASVRSNRPYTATGPAEWHPERAPYGPVSIVVSAADRRMVVLRNGVQIGSAPVRFDGEVERMQAYVLQSVAGGRYDWQRVELPGQAPAAFDLGTGGEAERFQGTDPFRQALASVVGPGTTMVVIPDTLGLNLAPAEAEPAVPMTLIENGPVVADWMSDARLSDTR